MFRCGLWKRLSIGVLGGMLAGTAAAGDEHLTRAEADIEQLDARLTHDAGSWRLNVRYEVDIEHAHHGEPFTLVLQLREDGRLVEDATGEPLTIGVPLDQPVRCDDNDCTFEDVTEFELPRYAVSDPEDIELTALVTPEGENTVLDDETTDVELVEDCPPQPTVIRTERSTVLDYEHIEAAPRVIVERRSPTVIVRERPRPIVIERPRPIVIREPRPIVIRESRGTIVNRRGSCELRGACGDPRRVPIRDHKGGVRVNVGVNW
ncbi:MAG: hypothetical protein ACKVS9_01205 [Phycisphaerae bacterium]